MPELPEIETLRLELGPSLTGRTVTRVRAYREGLREPFPSALLKLKGARILGVERRSKYLRLRFAMGDALIHLGMSGQLRLVPARTARGAHDHLDFDLDDGRVLRLRDPRRFGAVLWEVSGTTHPRLSDLGPEPLSDAFTPAYLGERLAGKKVPLKSALMDARVVVGVGNIYATEALFDARLSPVRPAGSLNQADTRRLVASTRRMLERGIALGGSSMRDYVHADGSLGGFLGQAQVYGRGGQRCPRRGCGGTLQSAAVGGRTTTWCPVCQT